MSDTYVAWCVNEASLMFGRHCENTIESAAASKNTPEAKAAAKTQALNAILSQGKKGSSKSTKGQFADPAKFV